MTEQPEQHVITAADAAVDGLIYGVIAGVVMAAYLMVARLTWGDAAAAVLGRFDPSGAASAMTGLFTHLAVSSVYGSAFALFWRLAARRLPVAVWVGAVAYGLLLWVLAVGVFLSAAGSALQSIPPLHFAIAHIFYGLALGLGLARRK